MSETIENMWTPKPVPRLHEIAGNECAKRALEVAMTGGHCIALISTTGAPASDLAEAAARIARENGWPFRAHIVTPCPCGNLGNPRQECNCSCEIIERHREKMRALAVDSEMFIEVLAPRVSENCRGAESEEALVNRVRAARMVPDTLPSVAGDAEEMLRMAATSLGGWVSRERSLSVARTVARMAGSIYIGAMHVCEAVQYVRNPFWDLDGPATVDVPGDDDLRPHLAAMIELVDQYADYSRGVLGRNGIAEAIAALRRKGG